MSNETLSINVHDDVKAKPVFGAPPEKPTEEAKEEPPVTDRYVAPHKTISRAATAEDVGRILHEADVMFKLTRTPHGIHPGAVAIAHPQIDDKDPLRFFVTDRGEVIINPTIKNTTKTTVDSKEGCMSYPDRTRITVQRHNVVDLEYQTLTKDGELTEFMTKTLTGAVAKIVQHETDHLDGKYVFDEAEETV